MLGPRTVFGENDPVIAPARTPVSFLAREHAHAAGSAGGIRTISGTKTNALISKLVQVLCLYDRISRETGHVGRVFVGQEKQNIGLLMHGWSRVTLR